MRAAMAALNGETARDVLPLFVQGASHPEAARKPPQVENRVAAAMPCDPLVKASEWNRLMSSEQLVAYPVWDAPTRWFHWINALSVLGLILVGTLILFAGDLGMSGAGRVTVKTIHVWIGYAMTLNLLWRFVWAFFGNRYARWRAILPGGAGYIAALEAYVAAFLVGQPKHYLGHNPIGRLAIFIILLLLIIQATTGLVLAGTDIFYPPFGNWIAHWVAAPNTDPSALTPLTRDLMDPTAYAAMRAFRSPFAEAHEFSFYILAGVVALHVVAVVVTELREGGALVSAMFTGRKIIPGRPEDL
jgi:Ni/Fe-hydrogenase 1 B-type cytochrome subunit